MDINVQVANAALNMDGVERAEITAVMDVNQCLENVIRWKMEM